MARLNHAAVGSRLGMLRQSRRLIRANPVRTSWEQGVPTVLRPDTTLQVGVLAGENVGTKILRPVACCRKLGTSMHPRNV